MHPSDEHAITNGPLSVLSAMWAAVYVSAHPQRGARVCNPRLQAGPESSDRAGTPGRGLHGILGTGARNWSFHRESEAGRVPWQRLQVCLYEAKCPREGGAAGDDASDEWIQQRGQRRVRCDCDGSHRGQDHCTLHRQDIW